MQDKFKSFLSDFAIYAGVPVIFAEILEGFGFNKSHVIIIIAVMIWILHTELRIRKLQNKINVKRKGKNARR
jgi:hypothetical protein